MVHDADGKTVVTVAPIAAGRGVSGPVEDDDDWDLGNIRQSRNADVPAGLLAYFTAIPTLCPEWNLTVSSKPGDLFALVLQGLDALQESRKAKAPISTLEACVNEHLEQLSPL